MGRLEALRLRRLRNANPTRTENVEKADVIVYTAAIPENHEELVYAKKMLRSAALTYVAAVTSTLLQILRLILIFRSND